MKRIYSILSLLLLCSIVAFADSERVVIANDVASHVVINSIEGNVVTLTVTPAEGQYLADISAMKTIDASAAAPQRRADIPVGAAYTLTKTSATADRSQEATYTMTLEDGFGAYVTATFADRTAITADQITLSAESFTYNGSDQKATVSIDGLTLDTDYTISYKETEWKDAGTYTVTITGIDSYKGTIEKTFEIGKKPLTDNDVVASISKVNNTYQVSVTHGEKTLVENTDYTLGEGAGQTSGSSYNYSIPVTGKGNYSGEVTATWSDAIAAYIVNVIDANNAEVSSVEVGTETTTVTISGTVSDGTNDVPVTSIADGTFTTENTANVLSIDLSETQVDLDMDRKADSSPVKDVPDNTLIYLPEGSTMTGDNVIVKGAGSDFTCNNFVMDDEKSYNVPHPFIASNATLNREFTAKQTCTVCLPFNVPAAGVHGKIYTFTSVANNQVTMTEDADGLDANVPYIFVPDGTNNISTTGSIAVEIAGNNTSANDFTFKSIYEDHTFTAKEIAKGIYGFAGANAVGATPGRFAKAATGAYIKGMRAYLEYTGSATDPGLEGTDVSSPRYNDLDSPLPDSMNVILVDADGTTTNIGKMELMEDGETPRYNLSGQRVGKSHKGIVIENSKKMVIK